MLSIYVQAQAKGVLYDTTLMMKGDYEGSPRKKEVCRKLIQTSRDVHGMSRDLRGTLRDVPGKRRDLKYVTDLAGSLRDVTGSS